MTQLGYNFPMFVRVILTRIPGEGCRASVASSAYYGHVWRKNFESKHICLTDLRTLGLLTAAQAAEVQTSDFDKNGGVMVFQAVTEPQRLVAARLSGNHEGWRPGLLIPICGHRNQICWHTSEIDSDQGTDQSRKPHRECMCNWAWTHSSWSLKISSETSSTRKVLVIPYASRTSYASMVRQSIEH